MNRYPLLLITILLTAAPARADPAADRLAAAAKAILEKSCARCHANGQAEGGFSFVLDAKQLVERKRVIAGNSAKSRLFKKVQGGEMPPEDEKPRPTAEEIAALKAWIDAGAPALSEATASERPTAERPTAERPTAERPTAERPASERPVSEETASAGPAGRTILSDKDAITAVRDHLQKLPAEDRPFQRYFTLTHLHNNPAVSEEDLRWQRAALAKAVNSLSWKPRIIVPRALDKSETVFA